MLSPTRLIRDWSKGSPGGPFGFRRSPVRHLLTK
jgi:hypothetical protein